MTPYYGLQYLFESIAEPLKHPLHVASLLHGDHPGVVLLVYPDQEVFLVVVPEKPWKYTTEPHVAQVQCY